VGPCEANEQKQDKNKTQKSFFFCAINRCYLTMTTDIPRLPNSIVPSRANKRQPFETRDCPRHGSCFPLIHRESGVAKKKEKRVDQDWIHTWNCSS
jgi:hypothetical protein